MIRRIQILVVLAALGVAGALLLPVSNLVIGLPGNTLRDYKSSDPKLEQAAAILGAKCVNCHTEEYVLPLYAQLPVAKPLIEMDIKEGLRHLDYLEAFDLAEGAPMSEVVLAKTEKTLQDNNMPPLRYLALHWDGGLSAHERDTLLDWIASTRAVHYATGTAAPRFANEVVQPIPLEHNQDPAKVALGDKLFHDKRLSTDNSLACAGCHGLDKGGTDQQQFSEGVGGQMGDINAPTVYNAVFASKQFWDGRAADLQEQADGPVNNPIEMASNWPEAIPKLKQDAELTEAFRAVYPEGYSKDTITDAIAVFEKTLITPNSKVDQYLMGDASALSEDAVAGYAHFKAFNCATCHVGQALGGQSFEIMGLKADYFADRGNPHKPDYGRYNVTGEEKDRFKLKVPTLRNIALTAPYLHDGTTSDLAEVVDIMAKYEVGRELTAQQNAQIVAFLEALTGEYQGKILQ